jgi:hypothetical protein
MTDSPASRPTDRRRFLMLMGLACASTAIVRPTTALAQSPAPPPPVVPPQSAEPAPPSAEALALAEVVRVRHGKDLSAPQLRAIAEDLDSRLDSGRELRKLGHANGVEPDTLFHA